MATKKIKPIRGKKLSGGKKLQDVKTLVQLNPQPPPQRIMPA